MRISGVLLFVGVAVMGLATSGCGGDCVSACEDGKECSGSQTKDVDCDKACADAEAQADKLGCRDQYDSLTDCASGEDVCEKNNTACASEASEFLSCTTDYCKSHADDSACAGGAQQAASSAAATTGGGGMGAGGMGAGGN